MICIENMHSFFARLSAIFIAILTISCSESTRNCDKMDTFHNGKNTLCYVNYSKSDQNNAQVAGEVHFLYPVHKNMAEIFTLEYAGNGRNIEKYISDDMPGRSGDLYEDQNIFQYTEINIAIPKNDFSAIWKTYDDKYSCSSKKFQNNDFHIICENSSESFSAIYNNSTGLKVYETKCGKAVCRFELRSKEGLYSRSFLNFYSNLGILNPAR
jgi:hypothetical protein